MRSMSALVLATALLVPGPAAAQEAQVSAPTPAAEAPAEPGLLKKFFVILARDVKALPSRDNATVLLNGGILAVAAFPLDDIATLGASSSPFLKIAFSGVGKAIGREWVQGGGALAAYIAGRVWDQPRLTGVASDLIEAQLVGVTVTQGLKFAVSRTRPDGEARSFPSGHASSAFATARVLQRHFGAKAAIPAYAVAVYTSASRLQANSHYASDVFVGAALGIALGTIATAEIANGRLQVAPTVVDGGVMLSFAIR